jgi:hypothetical protein
MTPDQVVIDYIELKKSAFFDQVKVNDEELKALYERKSPTWPSSAMPRTSSSKSTTRPTTPRPRPDRRNPAAPGQG